MRNPLNVGVSRRELREHLEYLRGLGVYTDIDDDTIWDRLVAVPAVIPEESMQYPPWMYSPVPPPFMRDEPISNWEEVRNTILYENKEGTVSPSHRIIPTLSEFRKRKSGV